MGSGIKLLPADTSMSEWTGERSDPILTQNQPKKAKRKRQKNQEVLSSESLGGQNRKS